MAILETIKRVVKQARDKEKYTDHSSEHIRNVLTSFNTRQRNALRKKFTGRDIVRLSHNTKIGHVQVHFRDRTYYDFIISAGGKITSLTMGKTQPDI